MTRRLRVCRSNRAELRAHESIARGLWVSSLAGGLDGNVWTPDVMAVVPGGGDGSSLRCSTVLGGHGQGMHGGFQDQTDVLPFSFGSCRPEGDRGDSNPQPPGPQPGALTN